MRRRTQSLKKKHLIHIPNYFITGAETFKEKKSAIFNISLKN